MASMVQVMDWDADAQSEAMRQAKALQRHDPEAASLIIATLVVTQDAIEAKGEAVSRRPVDYEPIKLYDFLCKEYGWTPRQIDETHYITVFSMVNVANARHEREQDDIDRAMNR